MMFSLATIALSSALVASATTLTVNVGDNNQLVFNPTQVTAQVGDTIQFNFVSKNHSVTQSTFAAPCTRSPTGIDSGFLAANSSTSLPSWSFTLNDASTPLWFFCAQTNPVVHCQMGMVFAVNPTADKSFDAFQNSAKSAASAAGASGSAGAPGVIAPPTSLPTGAPIVSGAPGVASSPSAGFSSVFGGAAGAAGSSSASASISSDSAVPQPAAGNGALAVRGASSGVAVGAVTLIAAVASLLL